MIPTVSTRIDHPRRALIVAAAFVFTASIEIGHGAAAQSPPLSAAQLRVPCASLLTAAELRSLGRNDVLTRVDDEHGSSTCGWQDGEHKGVVVIRQGAEWFKYEHSSGAKASFDDRRKTYASQSDRVTSVGLDAFITRDPVGRSLWVRRAADVLLVVCVDCTTADQTIAIGKLAATP